MNFVLSCSIYQRWKHENVAYPGMLQPLEIPVQAWKGVSMDFVEGLSKSEGRNVVMVVVDRLTKSHTLSA